MKCGWIELSRGGGRPRRDRSGISLLEVLGCIVAIVVGVWAGATYLGVDLLALFRLGMDEAGVASPEGAPDGPSTDGGATADGDGTTSQPAGDAAEQETPGEATIAFWNRVREVIREEQAHRAEGERQVGGHPLAVLHIHREAYTLTAQKIRQVPTASVDAEATQLAEEIAAWYDRAAELAQDGTVLDAAEIVDPQGLIARRWHTSRKQHREELDLLSRKCSALRGQLTARYRVPFEELQ